MAPTKPPSSAKAASAGPTSARSYRRQPQNEFKPQSSVIEVRRRESDGSGRNDNDADESSDTTHESRQMRSRRDDFTERSWWMVDVDGEEDSNQGATALVKRCMRTHSWDLAKARKILSAYKQFMALKEVLGDWDATLLSPCQLVDMMWHQHILDNFNYYHDCIMLCGHFVGHNPDGAFEAAKVRRDEFTRECLRQNFGTYDVEVWDTISAVGGGENGNEGSIEVSVNGQGGQPDNEDQANNDVDAAALEQANINNGVVRPENEVAARNDDPNRMTVRIKALNGEETLFRIARNTQMRILFRLYASKKGAEESSFRFMIDGAIITQYKTPAMLELGDGDTIHCLPVQNGC